MCIRGCAEASLSVTVSVHQDPAGQCMMDVASRADGLSLYQNCINTIPPPLNAVRSVRRRRSLIKLSNSAVLIKYESILCFCIAYFLAVMFQKHFLAVRSLGESPL